MNFTNLLLLSDSVPTAAKQALLAAKKAPPDRREKHLLHAAKALQRGTDLDCEEIRDLICD
jgi:hypothetical protein